MAEYRFLLAFDNISSISNDMADMLCRLLTGGGFSTRKLYSNRSEIRFNSTRPLILSGIDNLLGRFDLADRSMILSLKSIAPTGRASKTSIFEIMIKAAPDVLGLLCNAVCTALKTYRDINPKQLPRMADLAIWLMAAEPALPLPKGALLHAYKKAMDQHAVDSIEDSPVALAIETFLKPGTKWQGSILDLLEELRALALWSSLPTKGARKLRSDLQRIQPALSSVGITVEFNIGTDPVTRRTLHRISRSRKGELRFDGSDASDPSL